MEVTGMPHNSWENGQRGRIVSVPANDDDWTVVLDEPPSGKSPYYTYLEVHLTELSEYNVDVLGILGEGYFA